MSGVVFLPEHTTLNAGVLREIAVRHGLRPDRIEALPDAGIINAIYRINDDYVLRVPRAHPAHVAQTLVEAVAAPAARSVGVHTPQLIAFNATRDLIPVPYSIFEWVPGVNLESLGVEPSATPEVWRKLGRDLALLHTGVSRRDAVADLPSKPELPDPRRLAEERASDGWFTSAEVRWLVGWLDRIAPAATLQVRPRLLHQDTQATNVIVDPSSCSYVALLDWGCAGWGDPASDFGMPMRAVPAVLSGYRAVTKLDEDEAAEARILWFKVQQLLTVLPRGAAPGLSWGERPIAWLLEIFRFFLDEPGGPWKDIRP